jgi:protein TonB
LTLRPALAGFEESLMFDSILAEAAGPQSQVRTGAAVSVLIHGALLALGLGLGAQKVMEAPEPELTIRVPPPKGTGVDLYKGRTVSAPETSTRPRRNTPVAQRERVRRKTPSPVADTAKPDAAEASPASKVGTPDGTLGHEGLGHREGAPQGVGGGTPGGVQVFRSGMTPPVLLSGPHIAYTPEARAARVEGLMVVRCIIEVDGSVGSCELLKPVPHMERAVLEALRARRYKPVMVDGQPMRVKYTFNVRLVLPR